MTSSNVSTRIIIRTIGNRSLYASLYSSIDSETRHRTVSGAARRLVKIARQARTWSANVGKWGSVEIEIDGNTLHDMDVSAVCSDAQDVAFGSPLGRYPALKRIEQVLGYAA
jgi:hypothetical protein